MADLGRDRVADRCGHYLAAPLHNWASKHLCLASCTADRAHLKRTPLAYALRLPATGLAGDPALRHRPFLPPPRPTEDTSDRRHSRRTQRACGKRVICMANEPVHAVRNAKLEGVIADVGHRRQKGNDLVMRSNHSRMHPAAYEDVRRDGEDRPWLCPIAGIGTRGRPCVNASVQVEARHGDAPNRWQNHARYS